LIESKGGIMAKRAKKAVAKAWAKKFKDGALGPYAYPTRKEARNHLVIRGDGELAVQVVPVQITELPASGGRGKR
jgi:hypothetical protein